MDAVINYDEAVGFLKNSPLLELGPNFDNICTLQKHIVKALSQLSCPQSAIHSWSGLAMDPATYFLLEGVAFTIHAVIDYDKAVGFLKNPPSLDCPNFDNICALQKHMVKALSQLSCPQSAIHGWSGLAMDPATYFLLEGVAFTIPANPGPMVNFPNWSVPTAVKTIEATFNCDKNYFLS